MLQAPRFHVPPSLLKRSWAGLLFLASAGLFGCPSTTADPIQILSVQVLGDPASTEFELEVEGRGFGLHSVSYDLSSGTGTSSTVDLSIRISRQNGSDARIFRGAALTVQSPRLLKVALKLDQALVAGIYRLELMRELDVLAEEATAFEVMGDAPPKDAGVDAGSPADTGVPNGDGGPLDTGAGDTGAPDTGPPDSGEPDSGLGPFVGNYAYRRSVNLTSGVEIPAGATIVVPVPHATLIAEAKAQPDGRDLRVYQGSTPLEFQWADTVALATDGLEIVARVARPIPVGGTPGDALALYYGDPAATNTPGDGVFLFIERFEAPISPVSQGNDTAWFKADNWVHCNGQHGIDAVLPNGDNHAYCALDRSGGLARSTLATPRQTQMSPTPGANLIYEMSLWMAGQTPDNLEDLTYFSYGADNETFPGTVELPPAAWQGLLPDGQLTFQDNNGQNRLVNGWRFTPGAIQWWQRTRARFVPTIDQPSLHFRFVSTDNSSNNGAVLIDDWWVRLAVQPEPVIVLGEEELMP